MESESLVLTSKHDYGAITDGISTPPTSDAHESSAADVGTTKRRPGKKQSMVYCVHGNLNGEECCDNGTTTVNIKHLDNHCHNGDRASGIDKRARKKLIIASILCVIFMIVEIIGGVLSNSLAIATDAAHLLADLAAFMISLFAIWVAAKPSTKRLSFGWHRAEVIGALVSVLTIWVVTAILVYLAVLRVVNQDFELEGAPMLITSAFGILVNIIMGMTLHGGHGHSHGGMSHGHAHDEPNTSQISSTSDAKKAPAQNLNVRAAFIHVISDFMQSLGVFIASLVLYFKPEWSLIDPICTFVFSILVLGTTIAIMKDALLVLMEGVPKFLDYTDVMQTFLQIPGVVRVHNLRIWALSINKIALAAHLAVEPNANTEQILKEATRQVHKKFNFYESTLQIEEFSQEMEDCNQCLNPNE
ncbi:proton-coupled zinc antiporter SLC30A2-like [Culicoides brevitarsis]|uniref:proton-coupled zinc antiporter SLC30A2-like n=1 Tax=Culicoides brevitarsis TaxID=469753 RepID=UPI00307B490B